MAAIAPEPPSEDFATRIQTVQAKLAQSVARAGLKDDAYAHVIEAQSAVLGELAAFVNEVRQARQPEAVITDQQVERVALRLVGSCKAWARSFVGASYWRSHATLAAVIIAVAALAFGAGWWMHAPMSELACADQADGSRICWMYTRLPTPPPKH